MLRKTPKKEPTQKERISFLLMVQIYYLKFSNPSANICLKYDIHKRQIAPHVLFVPEKSCSKSNFLSPVKPSIAIWRLIMGAQVNNLHQIIHIRE